MKNVEEYLYPSNLTEALTFKKEKKNSTFIAGGVHLANSKNPKITSLIDITKLGLDKITAEDNFTKVGATVTVTEMYESPLIAEVGKGVLSKACSLIGDTPLRNQITLGGNIAHLYTWAGLPVVLLTLDAQITIQKINGESYTVSADEYFARGAISDGELIKEVKFAKKSDWFHSYEKFSLTTVDYTWLTMAFAAKVQDGKISDSRLAVSRVTKAKRISRVETGLKGQILAELNIDDVVQILQQEVDIVQDYRSSRDYRKQLLGALFKRMLQKLQEEFQ